MRRASSVLPLLMAACLGILAGCLLVTRRGVENVGKTVLFGVDPSHGQRLLRVNQLDETPFWLGFRSSIDGYNVNQSPNTFPGGAQDQQEPVPYPYPWANGNTAGGVGEQTTATTGGGVNVNAQGKGLKLVALEETYPFSPPAALDSDPKHGFGGYGGGTNAGAYESNPGGSYYCADCTW